MGAGMTSGLDQATRDRLLADPSVILDDRDLMRALVGARDSASGGNVIDIRGRAMEVLESRLDRLEATHESVIAAAYDNQSGTAVVHRAVLSLLEPTDFTGFITALQDEVAPMLRIEALHLVFEQRHAPDDLPRAITIVPNGGIGRFIAAGRRAPRGDDIILRPAAPVTEIVHGLPAKSEALVPVQLGEGLPNALLLMGSLDPGRFTPQQGTDLLRFFGQVFRLVLLGWLRR